MSINCDGDTQVDGKGRSAVLFDRCELMEANGIITKMDVVNQQ
jgi:hypothetical protein